MPIDFDGASSFTAGGGASTLLGFSATAYVTAASQPAFNAYGVTGTTQGNFVIFPSVMFDNTTSYNGTTGRFTAPAAGTYYFYYQQLTNAVAGEYRVVFYKNGVWYGGSDYISYIGTANYWSVYTSNHIPLAANDYVNVLLQTAPSAMYAGVGDTAYGQFSGYLVG